VSAYTLVHTTTLSFVTLAPLDALLPYDLRHMNPVIANWRIDETATCEDIVAGFGWDEDWLIQCSRGLNMVQMGIALGGLVLMVAQWWALIAVRSWSIELQSGQPSRDDVEKASFLAENNGYAVSEKSELWKEHM
jgi:hypothetical protein